MFRIQHRVNNISQLKNTPINLGVEVDIRSTDGSLITNHDPITKGEDFEYWLEHYSHAFLILNVKEEGLEELIISLMKKNNIYNFFFLDQSFPFLIKTAKSGESRCAVRVSEFESIETAMSLSGKVDWAWIDCFTLFPLSNLEANRLQSEGGFKLCFVSPELQRDVSNDEIISFRNYIESLGIHGDAVCTKRPELWY